MANEHDLSGFSNIQEWYNEIESSMNLANARFVRVDDEELGTELFEVPPYLSWAHREQWGAQNA